jgi:DNA-binding FrmR family transcriptional regulator
LPYSLTEKKKAVTRLKKIQGQALALERAIQKGTDCSELLQQIAALRGAANGLMIDVLESHLKETFGPFTGKIKNVNVKAEIDMMTKIVGRYLK